jgi:hypothetical protein
VQFLYHHAIPPCAPLGPGTRRPQVLPGRTVEAGETHALGHGHYQVWSAGVFEHPRGVRSQTSLTFWEALCHPHPQCPPPPSALDKWKFRQTDSGGKRFTLPTNGPMARPPSSATHVCAPVEVETQFPPLPPRRYCERGECDGAICYTEPSQKANVPLEPRPSELRDGNTPPRVGGWERNKFGTRENTHAHAESRTKG